jgi:hypothetical protein
MRSLRYDGIKWAVFFLNRFCGFFYFAMLGQTNLQEGKDGDAATINNYTAAFWF